MAAAQAHAGGGGGGARGSDADDGGGKGARKREEEEEAFVVAAAVPPTASLWQLDISGLLGEDFAPMANDVARMVCIQVTIQLLMALSTGGDGGAAVVRFWSADFALLLMYIALGVMLYWLAVRRVVSFT